MFLLVSWVIIWQETGKIGKTGSANDYNPLGKQGFIVDIIESEEDVYYYQIKVGGEF